MGVSLQNGSPRNVFCESCIYAKTMRQPISKIYQGERATQFGGEIHMDLWGPAPSETLSGKKYYVTFTDDMMWLTHLYLLRSKDKTFGAYQEYEAWCNTQLNAHVKTLHSDRGGEYLSDAFKAHLKARGTTQKLTVA